MKRRRLQLSRSHRRTLFTVSLVLFTSGLAWALVHWLDQAGRAGDHLRQWKPVMLQVHGLGAVGFVLLFGTLLPGHVRRSWHARKNRGNGAFFLITVSVLIVTGYALYYLGDETWRTRLSNAHVWLGLAAPALLVWHIFSGRRVTGG
jgi:hypothetical protein